MSRALGAVLFLFTVGFSIALGVLTVFAVGAFGAWHLQLYWYPEPVAVGAGSAVAILGIAGATIVVCRLTGVRVPTPRVHLEQSFLLYVAVAATLIAHVFGEQGNAAVAWAQYALMAFAAALVNAVALVLYGYRGVD